MVATGVLILAIIGLVLYGLVGAVWAVAIVVAVAVALFAASLAWRRKGKGGLSRRPAARAGGRTGGAGGGMWPGLLGSRRTKTGAGRRGAGGGKRGGGLLGKMSGGRLGRRTGAAGGRSRTGGAAGGGGGRRGGFLGLGGRRGSGSGKGGTAGRRPAVGGLSSLRRAGQQTGKGGPVGKKPSGWQHFRAGWNRTVQKHQQKPTRPAASTRPAAATATPNPGPAKSDPAKVAATKAGSSAPPAATPTGQNRQAGPTKEDTTMTDHDRVRYSDDQSLQTAGLNLKEIEQAAQEQRQRVIAAEEGRDLLAQVVGKVRDQFDTDLPASKTLVSEVDALHRRMSTASTSDEWRSIEADAATLHGTYLHEHEMDEERLHNPRNGHRAEARADVSHAITEQ